MYISVNNCKTQGLRKAYINALNNDRHYPIKELKKIDKNLARTYTNTKYYGGSLKSFWNKVKKFGKKVITTAVRGAKQMYKPMKWMLNTAANNKIVGTLIQKTGNLIGSSVGVPTLGNIVHTAIKGANTISDGIEHVINAIKEKNPSLAVSEIKDVVKDVKDSVDNVVEKVPLSDEQKKKYQETRDKIYDKLPSVIKAEGLAKVKKAAGYLAFLDKNTYTSKERTGKGGRILKPMNRFKKPDIITKNPMLFNRYPKYSAEIIGDVGGRVFGSGKTEGCGLKDKKKSLYSTLTPEQQKEYQEYAKKIHENIDKKLKETGMNGMTNTYSDVYVKKWLDEKSGRIRLDGGESDKREELLKKLKSKL